MYHLIFASNNQHKVDEVKYMLPAGIEVSSLQEAGIHIDIPEPHETLQENAREKSTTIYKLTGKNCFSEDTGLEVAALNGAPGVHSARYAGEDKSAGHNITKLLYELKTKNDRRARFRTVISLILDGVETQFEGICDGKILDEIKGQAGFGYDPVFVPDGSELSFAEMGPAQKNTFSHRRKAMDQLTGFLNIHAQSRQV